MNELKMPNRPRIDIAEHRMRMAAGVLVLKQKMMGRCHDDPDGKVILADGRVVTNVERMEHLGRWYDDLGGDKLLMQAA